ncbi:MAG: DNA sulfur modification protein DndB [Pseudomonadota bacterium]
MSDKVVLRRNSALNLTLKGSVGSFSIGSPNAGEDVGRHSVETLYFLTHVGLDFRSGANQGLLRKIAPVREIFDFKELDFDQIMQRDIDDARISAELIPYLLDRRTTDLVKLFPPIIVVVLPKTEGGGIKPASHYPEVTVLERDSTDADPIVGTYNVIRAGNVGSEVFMIERPLVEGDEPSNHDLVRFHLNTDKTALVIVDGQHRAMALLALFRNLHPDQWDNAKRSPFKEYYAEWTRKYIEQFELDRISLPVMLCTFPQLDVNYRGDFDLGKAARSIFLTLNKTARKVTVSRNRLLDDSDLISHFLRSILGQIKERDLRHGSALRIHNVELDQFEDQMVLSDPIAITGVSHVYYIIEHLLLNRPEQDVKGVGQRSGYFSRRKDLDTYHLIERLDAFNLLGESTAKGTARDLYTDETAELLTISFNERYGAYILGALDGFVPFDVHAHAALALEKSVSGYQDQKLKPILFDGQGIGNVFDQHRKNLKEKLKVGYFEGQVPEIQKIVEELDQTKARLDMAVTELQTTRAENYFSQIKDPTSLRTENGEVAPYLVKWLNDLYSNTFTTVAFQSALVCGFFNELEQTYGLCPGDSVDTEAVFTEYLNQLNSFFFPANFEDVRRLHRALTGLIEGEPGSYKLAQTNETFREVVLRRNQMKPDLWPTYKYLLLEIWVPGSTADDSALHDHVAASRDKARHQVFRSLYRHRRKEYSRDQTKSIETLEPGELNLIFDRTYSEFSAFLTNIGHVSPPEKNVLRVMLDGFDDSEDIDLSDNDVPD